MKWLLIIIINHVPIQTDMIFDSLEQCMAAEDLYRKQVIEYANKDFSACKTITEKEGKSGEQATFACSFHFEQAGYGACIPHKQ